MSEPNMGVNLDGAGREPAEAREALDLIREIGGDDLVRSLMRTFLDYADELMQRASFAAEAGDAPEIARVAHSLKSSARQLGVMAFADACAAAELAGLRPSDPQAAFAGVEVMRRALASARPWLEATAATA